MPLAIGETKEVWGSGSKPYILKNCDGTVWSCTCGGWRFKGGGVMRTCKHLLALRGQAAEEARLAGVVHKPVTLPVGTPAPQCACHQGSSCDISHDPATCSCSQCTTTEGRESPEDVVAAVMGVKVSPRTPKAQEDTTETSNAYIEMDKSKRLNQWGGFVPFTDQEKEIVIGVEESRKGRKLRQDEKADLFGPPVLLANSIEDHEDLDPTGWLESEKLDGVRAYWSGVQFISRQGNIFMAPDFFIAALPKEPLDGELWMGRRMFQKTISVVKSQNSGKRWTDVKFVIFDAPTHKGTFEERLAHLKSLFGVIGQGGSWAEVHPHHVCDGRQGLLKRLADMAAVGGEGLMIRKPGSLYEARRSSTLLKAKPFKDAEAELIGYEPGKKQHKGKVGGFILKMSDGKTFNVNAGTEKNRVSPPAIGSTITYRYTDLTDDGKPKCASFVAVRGYE